MVENNRARTQFQTDNQFQVNQADIVVVDKEWKTAVVMDVAIPADSNIRPEGRTGTDVKGEIQKLVPVLIRALGAIRGWKSGSSRKKCSSRKS